MCVIQKIYEEEEESDMANERRTMRRKKFRFAYFLLQQAPCTDLP